MELCFDEENETLNPSSSAERTHDSKKQVWIGFEWMLQSEPEKWTREESEILKVGNLTTIA